MNKYVIIDEISPIIFACSLSHVAFKPLGKITGAGFVNIIDNKIYVYGESLSLKMVSKQADTFVIAAAMGFAGEWGFGELELHQKGISLTDY